MDPDLIHEWSQPMELVLPLDGIVMHEGSMPDGVMDWFTM